MKNMTNMFLYRTTTIVRVFGLLILFAGLSGCGSAEEAAESSVDSPNILWLTAEDMSADLGAYGDAYAETPHLDRLARQGVTYTNAFATAPVCSPARFTLLTGVYATTAGTQGLRSQTPIPDDITGFPSYLRALGYYATNNVKTDYNTSAEQRLIAESWDESSAEAHWRGREDGQPFFAVFNHMHTHQSRISFLDTEFPELTEALGAHDPANAPLPPYYPDDPAVRKTVARYYDAVTAMDANVGRLLAELEEDGVADNTIVFFYGDHGTGLPRGKRVLYDSGLHVPLIIYFPPKWRHLAPAPPGSSTDRLVSFVDFAPTMLRLVGQEVPAHMQGAPFLNANSLAEREFVFGARDRVDEAYDLARSARDERFLYIRHYHPHLSWNQPEFFSDQAPIRQAITRLAGAGALNAAQMTYAGPSKPAEELFDTVTDPYQIRNLADSPAYVDVLDRMRARLTQWEVETRDLGFMDEAEALRLAEQTGRTPLEFAADPSVYPLTRVLDTANLAGRSRAAGRQAALLRDPDDGVRYWAVLGLHAAGAQDPLSQDALRNALGDAVPAVRTEAAAALVAMNGSSEALAVLEETLETGDPLDVLRAARALQLLGEKAAPAEEAMRRVMERAQDEAAYGPDALYIRFALEPALAEEQGVTEVY